MHYIVMDQSVHILCCGKLKLFWKTRNSYFQGSGKFSGHFMSVIIVKHLQFWWICMHKEKRWWWCGICKAEEEESFSSSSFLWQIHESITLWQALFFVYILGLFFWPDVDKYQMFLRLWNLEMSYWHHFTSSVSVK